MSEEDIRSQARKPGGEGVAQPLEPTVYIDPISSNARRILANAPVRLVGDPALADLLWMRRGYTRAFHYLRSDQLINHIPNEGAMINKARLTGHLGTHDVATAGEEATSREFYPESYRLSHPLERDAFLEKLPDVDEPENLWILKPGGLSRGKGVRILWQFDRLKAQLVRPAASHRDPEVDLELDYVAQRYVRNPLLLEGRKSEIRVYWLVASLDPLMVLIYQHGCVRYTLLPFRLGDYENPLVHTANVFQQKDHPDYDPAEEPKWSFEELQAYLVDQRLGEQDYIEKELMPRIRKSLASVVRATVDMLRVDASPGCFGLFGADFILDETLRPWLIEVQKSPGLSHSDRVKKQVVPPMLKEAVRFVLEGQRRRHKKEGLDGLESSGFEWVIDER